MSINHGFDTIFEPDLIREIMQFGEFKSFSEGELIMDYGKYIRFMPLIVQGTIKVLKKDDQGKELLLYYLSANESCSMAYSCCMEAKKSEVKAIAEDDTQIIAVPHVKLDEWLCKYPSWKNYIMRSFNERFMELLRSIENIAFHKLDDRLLHYLKEKQHCNGQYEKDKHLYNFRFLYFFDECDISGSICCEGRKMEGENDDVSGVRCVRFD